VKKAGLILAMSVFTLASSVSAQITRTPVSTWTTPEGVIVEKMGYQNSWDNPGTLYSYLSYNETATGMPLIVSMHGYSESAGAYVPRTMGLTEEGYFVMCVGMRGRDGSAGSHDSGGLEVHDIYDAVKSLQQEFPTQIDWTRVGIQGWSGGGGNVSSSMTKMPDMFNMGASFYGIANYERWQEILDATNPTYPGPAYRIGERPEDAPNRYLARNSTLGARNNPYSEIFLFNDVDEPTCYPDMDEDYKANADAAGLTNVNLTVTGPGDTLRFKHGSPIPYTDAHPIFLDPFKNGDFAKPVLADSGGLTVLGYVLTEKFRIYAGNGEDAVANVDYTIDGDTLTFDSETYTSAEHPDSIDPEKDLTIRLPKSVYGDQGIWVLIDGKTDHDVQEDEEFYTIVADSLDSNVVVTVPEPASLSLLGLGGLALLRRRRNNRA
jgi:hypothetical protein